MKLLALFTKVVFRIELIESRTGFVIFLFFLWASCWHLVYPITLARFKRIATATMSSQEIWVHSNEMNPRIPQANREM